MRAQEHNTKETESATQTRNKHPIIKYLHTVSQKHRQDVAASLSVDKRIHWEKKKKKIMIIIEISYQLCVSHTERMKTVFTSKRLVTLPLF